jgi:hypothetical protein
MVVGLVFGPGERPLRTDSRSGFGRLLGRDVLGSNAVFRHRCQGRPLGRSFGAGRVASGKSREAAEEVGPRRGNQAHGRNERFRCPKGCRTQRTRSRSNASKSSGSFGPRHFRRPATGSGGRDHPKALQRHGGRQAVVTPYGCGRGELFVGSRRRGKRGPPHPRHSIAPSWRGRGTVGAGCRKRGEPQDRQRDATSPRSFARRKPARWCETTRSERDAGRVVPSARGSSEPPDAGSSQGLGSGSGRALETSVEGRKSRTPGEAGSRSRRSELRFRSMAPRGARRLCGRFEGEWQRSGGRLRGACIPRRSLGVVLEGPGPVTVEGRGGRRKEPPDLLVEGFAEVPTVWLCLAAAPQSSKITRLHGSCLEPRASAFGLVPRLGSRMIAQSSGGMVLDRGSGLVGELALRQAETSGRSVVAETRLPADEPGQRWRRSGDTSASVATQRRR